MSESQELATGDANGAAPPPDASPPDIDLEQRARANGWRPKEQWKGDPNRWVDAETFMRYSDGNYGVLMERNRRMESRITEQSQQLTEMRDMMAQQVDRMRRAETVGYNKAKRELEAQRQEAIRNADVPAVQRIDEEIQELGPDPKVVAAEEARRQQNQQASQPDPVVVDWVEANPWVTANASAWDMAVVTLNRVRAEIPNAPLATQLAEVKRRVMPIFNREATRQADAGDAGGAPSRRDAPPTVSRSGSAPAPRVQPRTFDAMPDDVKKQYEKEKRVLQGKGEPLTKEEFATYYWEQYEEIP